MSSRKFASNAKFRLTIRVRCSSCRPITAYGRGAGVGRDLGAGVILGLAVGVDVAVAVAVAVGVGVGVGVGPVCAQYLPPVFKGV